MQSAISIGDYGELTGDTRATGYANRMLAAAKAMLPRFDTGHWTRYAIGVESNLHYQDYVIDLLKLLATRTGDPVWTDTADRFELYETQPPLMTGPTVTRLVYPLPEDGVRDSLVTRFWLSKPSKVALIVDGKAIDGNSLTGGWHTFRGHAARARAGLARRPARGDAAPMAIPARPTSVVRGRPRHDLAAAGRVEGRRTRLLAREGRRERVLPDPDRPPSRLRDQRPRAVAHERLGGRAGRLLAGHRDRPRRGRQRLAEDARARGRRRSAGSS